VISKHAAIDPVTKQRFQNVVVQTRRPGACTGRPVVMQDTLASPEARRR
jgi:hypothetical protein